MRRIAGQLFNFFLLALLLVIFWGCDEDKIQDGESPEIRPLTAEEKFLIESSNSFAMELLNETQTTGKPNVSLSPIGASMALGIIGNAGTSEHFNEFKHRMGLPQLNDIEINKAFYEVSNMLPYIDNSVKLGFTNSIWTNYDLSTNESFYNNVMAYFKTDIWEFREEKIIDKKLVDKWLVNHTNNSLSAIESYDPDANFKIINLSTFSGKMFEGTPCLGVNADFYGINGEFKTLGMNFYPEASVSSVKNDLGIMMEIPIGNSNYLLNIVMPHSPNTPIKMEDFSSSLDYSTTNLLIPDITSSYEFKFDNKLKQLGAEEYLNKALSTTFSGRNLETSLSCVNKSVINIKGARLPGNATLTLDDIEYQGQLIKVDRPFYYWVKEKHTELIVFEGKYFQP